MSAHITGATARIIRQLSAAEAASDSALIAKARLLEAMLEARCSEDVTNPFEGQDAIIGLTHAINKQATIANELSKVHGRLLKVGQTYGIMDEECPGGGRSNGSLKVA